MRTKVLVLTPLAWACAAAFAQTLPSGGQVVQGSGSVLVNGTAMTVNQTSQRLIADWQSFSIGAGNTVRFVQPSSSSVALNRVLGADPSRIFGSLSANGHVYLQNPNGVYFAPGAQVDVGSLVATTLNADAQQFMAGRLRLSGDPAGTATVVNEGRISTPAGGHVVLAAAQVDNRGHITTPHGTTALAAGSAVEIDPTGAGLLRIRIPTGALQAHLAQSGTIRADGGAVSLQAVATDAALRSVMQVDGIVRARSIEQRDGRIVLSGGPSGIVAVGGSLDASGSAGADGGTVKVLGDRVALLDGARVHAGGVQGGTVLVGGNFQGQGPEANAWATYVGPGAVIDASARGHGDGGRVIVWADGQTTFGGQIAARGGSTGGDGGFVEVSGKQLLNFLGAVDTRAPAGAEGTLLLDPTNLTIGTVANLNGDATLGDDLVASPLLATDFAGTNSQITATRVATLLATGNVSLAATNSISVDAPLTVAAGGAASTLSLTAPTIDLNSPITLNNASLVADTSQDFSDSISVNADLQSLNSIALTSTDIFIDDASITAGAVSLTSPLSSSAPTSTVGQTSVGGIVTPSLTLGRTNNAASVIDLTSPGNRIGTLVLNSQSADIRVDNVSGAALTVRGSVDQSLTLQSASAVTQAVGAAGALSVGGSFSVTTTGADPVADAVTLTNAANQLGGTITFNVASNFSLATADVMSISGTAERNIDLVAGGAFNLFGAITSSSTTNPSTITIDVPSFTNGNNAPLVVQPGGRFIIRSANPGPDTLGIATGTGIANINHVVFDGWTGADPASGNVYFSGRTATIAPPGADRGDVSKVYDGSTAFAYTQAGTSGSISASAPPGAPVLFDSVTAYTVNGSGTFADKNVGTDKAYTVAASNDVVATGSSGATIYGAQFAGFTRPGGTGAAGVAEVTPRPITTSGITAVDRVYDAGTSVALDTTGVVLNNTVGGDSIALAAGATGSMSDKNVGTGKPVAIGGLTLSGTDAGNYTVTDASNATVDITPATLTSSGYSAVNRVYDGSTTVGVNASAATLTGVLGSDLVTIASASGTMANKNVGTAKPVAVSAALAGADAANYTVSATGTTVTITPRPITSTGIDGVDRVYDTTTAVALDASGATLANTISGDAVALSLAGATGTMADKNVGTDKPVTIAGLGLTGADAANYVLTDTSSATATISPFALTPTGIVAIPRVEDGSTTVTLNTGNATVIGVLPGDTVTLDASGAVGSVSTPDPGAAKPVTVTGLELGGADAANYSILTTPVTSSGAGLTVRILSVEQAAFEEVRYKEYLQGVSDAQEPFRRAMAEALASGFGKENIRKQLTRGLVFETGLAPPAVDRIEPARRPAECSAGAALACAR